MSPKKPSRTPRRPAAAPSGNLATVASSRGVATAAPNRDVTAAASPRRGIDASSARASAAPSSPDVPAAAALQTADQVRTVAHLLSDAADAYNQRLKAEAATLSSGDVFARLQEEQRLRGVANQLYFEASDRTLADAVEAQQALEATLSDAHAKLLEFRKFQHVLALVADLLVLAGAILARKGPTVIAALKEVRTDLKAATAHDE